jgi:hypothetical protein
MLPSPYWSTAHRCEEPPHVKAPYRCATWGIAFIKDSMLKLAKSEDRESLRIFRLDYRRQYEIVYKLGKPMPRRGGLNCVSLFTDPGLACSQARMLRISLSRREYV